MARNFWKSFYQGFDAGDKMYARYQDLARRRDIGEASKVDQQVDQTYDEASIDQIRDPLEQAGGQWDEATQSYKMGDGGLYAPRQAPKFENGGYTLEDGSRVMPKSKYTLDGVTRDTAFTPEEVQGVRLQKMASVYDKYGDPEKAISLRANAQTMQLGKVQLENAMREAEQAKNGAKVLKLQQQYRSGAITSEEFMSNLIDATDPINGDGLTHTYKDNGDGTFEVSQFKDNKFVGAKTVSPDEAFEEALMYSSPTMYNNIFGQRMQKAELGLKRDGLNETVRKNSADIDFNINKLRQDKELAYAGLDWKTAEHNDEMDYKNRYLGVMDNYYRGNLAKQNYLNPLQQRQLDNMIKFDNERQAIIQDLEAGRIDEKQATQKINFLSRKFGGAALSNPKPEVDEPFRRQAATEAFAKADALTDPDGQPLSPQKKMQEAKRLYNESIGESSDGDPYDIVGAAIDKNMPSKDKKQGLQAKPSRVQQLFKLPEPDPLEGSVLRRNAGPKLSPFAL